MSFFRRILLALGIGAGAVVGTMAVQQQTTPINVAGPLVAHTESAGPQAAALATAAAQKYNQDIADAKAAADTGNYDVALGHVDSAEEWVGKLVDPADKNIASSKLKIYKKNLNIMRDARSAVLDLRNRIAQSEGEVGTVSWEQIGPAAIKAMQEYLDAQENPDFKLAASFFGTRGVHDELVRTVAVLQGIVNDESKRSRPQADSLLKGLAPLNSNVCGAGATHHESIK